MDVRAIGKETMTHAAKEAEIQCNRCHGWMSFEYFTNMNEGGGVWTYKGWRCISCGEVIDPLILSNRTGFEASVGVGRQSKSRHEIFSARLRSVAA
ncbi:MAG: hypothetical protein ACE5FY_04590 [Nitrospiria bacterium]